MSENQMTAQLGELPILSEDEVLAFTRGVRVKAITELIVKDCRGEMPKETGERIFLTNMLNGLDSQAMNIKKIASDTKQADSNAVMIAELLRSVNKNTAFAVSEEARTIDASTRVIPNSIGDVQALPGEMEVAPQQLDYSSFVTSQGKDIDQLGKNLPHPEEIDEDDGTP